MDKPRTILTSSEGPVATITLNRPRVHHAMNIEMVRELSEAISQKGSMERTRIILLRATGENFSAGADLNWMRSGMDQTEKQLEQESRELARLFRLISETPPVVISSVQGKVLGGAIGLVAASDLVIAANSARFAFSEVKLGLIPATIAPFVVRKVGPSRTAGWMITGRFFTAAEALEGGLVHRVVEETSLEENTGQLINDLLSNGPMAMKGIKWLLHHFPFDQDPEQIQNGTAEIIARYRVSPEGQEGMKAFFEKRKPGWHDNP
jgi:methylglutaconyl-CoA hydratase